MAKVLEALERARLERIKKLEEQQGALGDPMPDAVSPAPGIDPPTEAPAPHRVLNGNGQIPHRGVGLESIDEQIVGVHDNQSPIAEQVRQIRANLETVLAEYRSRPIVVTSPVTGDGKTLVAANLATVLADDPEHQVLLVDADMRRPDQHDLFGIPPTPGLADYLSDRCSLEAAIYETGVTNLKLIPAGRSVAKPTVLLSSDRMTALLGELQRRYQWIVFDTPPMLPVSDAAVLARECIGLILVVRMGQTHRKTIERAQSLLAEMRLPVLGCILNDFCEKTKQNEYYYHYYTRESDHKAKRRS